MGGSGGILDCKPPILVKLSTSQAPKTMLLFGVSTRNRTLVVQGNCDTLKFVLESVICTIISFVAKNPGLDIAGQACEQKMKQLGWE